MENQNSNKRSKGKKLLIGIGLLGLGALTFFGLDYYFKNKKKDNQPEPGEPKVKESSGSTKKQNTGKPQKPKAPVSKPKAGSPLPKVPAGPKIKEASFPLKKGDKGYLVKRLQEELIRQFGSSILPNDKDNGTFGSELEKALIKLQVPITNKQLLVTEAVYKRFVPPAIVTPETKAIYLRKSMESKAFERTLFWLKTIKDKAEYTAVSQKILSYRIQGRPQTLVNASLSTYTNENQKQQIRSEFLRMGLKYSGGKWSLNGTSESKLIITTGATKVWKDPKTSVEVPVNMVLGQEVTKRGHFTVFLNDNQHFLVDTNSVAYYRQ